MRSSLALPALLVCAPLLAVQPDAERLLASHPQLSPAGRVVPGGPISGVVSRAGSPVESPVTFSNQIVRILQAHCQTCHHEGDIAPFPLMTYQDAYQYRAKIQYMTSTRQMPPWHVDTSCVRFKDDPSLTDDELSLIDQWLLAGAPEGNPASLPAPLTFPSAWTLGEPDLVLTMQEAFTPDFSHGDVYRCFVLPTNLTEDRYVSALEVLPGVRSMDHHAILFVDTGTTGTARDQGEAGPGYTCFGGPGVNVSGGLGGWVPGNRPSFLPDGVGMALPKGSKIILQMHYSSRAGVVAPDVTTVGLHFAKGPIRKTLYIVPVMNTDFRIPAGATDYPVTAFVPAVPTGVHLLAVTPHMHLLGKTMEVTATLPDGTARCLVKVPDWDFHWQGTYFYEEPIAVPALSRVALVATYDNSAQNPENPNSPPRDVTFGEATTDEMCIAFLHLTVDAE